MMKNKNIAIISHSLYGGGAERIAGYLSKYLSTSFNVYLFLGDVSQIDYEYRGQIIQLDLSNLELDLIRNKKKYNIDCSISFLDRYNFANVKTRLDDIIILSQRNVLSAFNSYISSKINILSAVYGEADRIIACSHGVKQDFVENINCSSDSVEVIYNFVDFDRYRELSEVPLSSDILNWLDHTGYILNVGRLEYEKNQEYLIRQYIRYYHQCCSPYKLIIVGSGPLNGELKEDIEKNNMESQITILPYTDNPFPYYRNAEFLAMTSRMEGFPNVMIESMSFLKPTVSVDCLAGPRELLNDALDYKSRIEGYLIGKRGILVENESMEFNEGKNNFADAMCKMTEDTAMRNTMRDNILVFIDHYRNAKIEKQWIHVIENNYTAEHRSFVNEDMMIDNEEYIIIYGAGKRGKELMERVKKKKRKLCCFAVSRLEGEYTQEDVSAKEIDKLVAYREKALVVISAKNLIVQNEMYELASSLGFKRIILPIG